MNKSIIFEKEISYIKNEKYKEEIKKLIEFLPDYFFEVPASSTGKYHPSYALGKQGLIRHTKVATRVAYELLNNKSIGDVFTNTEKDLIIMALILHDGCKLGMPQTKYTVVDHPLVVCDIICEKQTKTKLNNKEIAFLCMMIKTHMGEWNKDFNENEVLEKPSNKYQKFVHMCDFLASKKFFDVKFLNNDIID